MSNQFYYLSIKAYKREDSIIYSLCVKYHIPKVTLYRWLEDSKHGNPIHEKVCHSLNQGEQGVGEFFSMKGGQIPRDSCGKTCDPRPGSGVFMRRLRRAAVRAYKRS